MQPSQETRVLAEFDGINWDLGWEVGSPGLAVLNHDVFYLSGCFLLP